MIYATELIRTTGSELHFTTALDTAISKWQDQGLEVEVQYQPLARPSGTPTYTALLIVRRQRG
jgi:hypothetical protein